MVRFDRVDNARAAKSLRDIGFESAIDLLSSYAERGPDLAPWLKGAATNMDRDLRLQYLAGIGLNVDAQHQIYSDLIEARQFPSGLFVASEETLAKLRTRLETVNRRSTLTPDWRPNLTPLGGQPAR